MRNTFLCAAAGISAFLMLACGMAGSKKASIPSDRDLRREYKESADAFKSKYDGKPVKVWGKTQLVDTDTGYVTFAIDASSDVSGAPTVECMAEKDDRKKFDDLHVKEGDMVQVSGTMKVTATDLRLENCKLDKFGISAGSDD